MIYFAIAYILLIIFVILEMVRENSKSKDMKKRIEYLRVLWIIGMVFYSLVGIITKDPLITDIVCNVWKVCLPPTLEWIIYIAIIGVLVWKFILSDMQVDIDSLKTDINSLKVESIPDIKKEISVVDERTKNIQKDVSWIKSNCKVSFKE